MATERIIIEVQARGTRRVTRQIGRIRQEASATRRTLALLRAGLVVVAGARVIGRFLELADALTNIRNRLRLVTSSTEQLTAVQTGLFQVAQETRSSFEANAELFNRLTRSASGLGLTYQNLLDITRGVNQAVAISGATAQEARNSLVQFSQGLAAGALRGDELRSVVEQFPRLADAIGQEFGVAGGALAAFAKENEGVLTTERIVKALRDALPELQQEFENVQITVEGAFTRFSNALTLFIGGITNSVRLGERLDTVLQAIARNLPEITVALITIAGIGTFNLLTDQVLRLHRTLLLLSGAILSPFIGLAQVLLLPITQLRNMLVLLTIIGTTIRTAFTTGAIATLTRSIFQAAAATRAWVAATAAGAVLRRTVLGVAGAFAILRGVIFQTTIAGRAFAALGVAFRPLLSVLGLLTRAGLRLLAVVFANPIVLGFTAVLATIVGGFLLLRAAINGVAERFDFLDDIWETVSAAILTGIDTILNSWRQFGPALQDIFLSSVNVILRRGADFFNFFIRGINSVLGLANQLGAGFGQIDLVQPFQIENAAQGAAERLADTIASTFRDRIARGGNVAEIRAGFDSVLGFFRDFLPPDLTEALEQQLTAVADVGSEFDRLDPKLQKAIESYDKLRASVDPLKDGLNEFQEAQETVNAVLERIGETEAAETLNLIARNLVGLNQAEFEFQQRQRLVNELLKEGALSAEEAALALRKLEIEAQGAFVSALNGTFPLLEAQQQLSEITVFLDENTERLAASGINAAEAQRRLAREAFGLGQTQSQLNEQIEALRRNQDLLGLSTAELEHEIRQLNIAFLETQRTAAAGANRAFLKLVDDATNAAKFTEEAFTDAFKAIEDQVVSFVETGTFSFNEFFRNIAQQLIRLGTQQFIAGLGGFGTNLLGGVGGFGAAGPSSQSIAGVGGLVTSLAGNLFGFQRGGSFTVGANTAIASLPGIDNRLIAFRAKDDEEVTVTPRDQAGAGAPINQVFNIQARDADSFVRSQSQIQNRALAGLNQARRRR